MKLSLLRFLLPLAAVALVAPSSAFATPTVIAGGTVSATYVISKSGSYVLGGDRQMMDPSKPAISITAPDVTLNLNGFTLSFPGGSSGTGDGIFSSVTENVEIRNGTVANAARHGVHLIGGQGARVIDLRVIGAKQMGLRVFVGNSRIDRCHLAENGALGIWSGEDCVVQNCEVLDNGTGGMNVGWRSRIVDCTVTSNGGAGVRAANDSQIRGCLISANNGPGIVSDANTVIANCQLTSNKQYGIRCLGHRVTILECFLHLTLSDGLVAEGISSNSQGNAYVRDTMVLSHAKPVVGSMIDLGGNRFHN